MNVAHYNNTPNGNGLSFRPPQAGPEADLVDRFIHREPIRIPRDLTATVFCQPRLDSGAPDVVFVIWDDTATKSWSPSRAKLTKTDIRLLHFIYQNGPISEADIMKAFRCSVSPSLKRLSEANTLLASSTLFKTRPLSHIFAVKRIIAIEAKIKISEIALSQAVMNTWFASESFVLVPRLSRDTCFWKTAKNLGIRVLDEDTHSLSIKSTASRCLPRSYASWLFNEWVWLSHHPKKGKTV